MTVSMTKKGLCECGREYRIFQPESKDVAEALEKAAAGVWEVTVLIAEGYSAKCSVCGRTITLPVAEELDPERSELGRLLLDIEEEHDD